ncbi:MAG: protein-tyrosine-phosphatase [Bacteroidota bacterium]
MKLFLTATAWLFFLHHSTSQSVQTAVSSKIEDLLSQENLISQKRKNELKDLANDIYNQHKEVGFSKVNFVCTHNSRRSQLSQIWFWRALEHFNLNGFSSYSGGTEATAFNHRMVSALQRYGFNILQLDEAINPKYVVRSGAAGEREMVLFSKKYADGFNPQKDFIAVMVCGQADAACPIVPGAYARVSLPYEDPKVADGTPREQKSYDDKVVEIGREILYMVGQLKELI